MTAVVFEPSLYEPIRYLPNLDKTKADTGYSILSGELGIEQRDDDGSFKGVTDLKEISAFVQGVLKDEAQLGSAIEKKSPQQKLQLYRNLSRISAHIDSHNDKIDSSFLIGLIHVILLVFTFGGFSYRGTLHIDNFISPLDKLGITDKQLAELPFTFILSMGNKDQDALLEKVGLLGKWKAFADKHPNCIEQVRNKAFLPQVAPFLHFLRLEHLQRVDDFEKSLLAMVVEDRFEKDVMKGIPLLADVKGILLLADVLHPFMVDMELVERNTFVACLPKELRNSLLLVLEVFEQIEQIRPMMELLAQNPEMVEVMSHDKRAEMERIKKFFEITPQQIGALQGLAAMFESV